MVDTQPGFANRNRLVEFWPWSPSQVAFCSFPGHGFHFPANDRPFLPGANHNFYLLDLHGDLDLRSENSPNHISISARFDFVQTPIDYLHFTGLFLFLFQGKWVFTNSAINSVSYSNHRNFTVAAIRLLPTMD